MPPLVARHGGGAIRHKGAQLEDQMKVVGCRASREPRLRRRLGKELCIDACLLKDRARRGRARLGHVRDPTHPLIQLRVAKQNGMIACHLSAASASASSAITAAHPPESRVARCRALLKRLGVVVPLVQRAGASNHRLVRLSRRLEWQQRLRRGDSQARGFCLRGRACEARHAGGGVCLRLGSSLGGCECRRTRLKLTVPRLGVPRLRVPRLQRIHRNWMAQRAIGRARERLRSHRLQKELLLAIGLALVVAGEEEWRAQAEQPLEARQPRRHERQQQRANAAVEGDEEVGCAASGGRQLVHQCVVPADNMRRW